MLSLWKFRREGCWLDRGGPRRMIRYKGFGNSKCEEFPKHRWWRKRQRAACARKLGAEGVLGNCVEWEKCVQTRGIHYCQNCFHRQRTLQSGIWARLLCRKNSYAKSLPHNSMSKTGSPPVCDKLPSPF